MKSMTKRATAFCACALFATNSAVAADLGSPKPQPPPEDYADNIGYNWSGLYFGGFLGATHGMWTVDFFRNNNHGHAEEGYDGIEGGGWLGYNFQVNRNFVIGVETDLGATNADQSNNIFDNDTSSASISTFGSLRGRLGYVYDRMLVFGTIGLAYANITNDIQKGQNAGEQVVSDNNWETGLALGAGVDYAFSNNWIGRVEYQYANFGTQSLINADGNRAEFENELHQLRVGVSYRY
jgi:outer membrane immunogenic protein